MQRLFCSISLPASKKIMDVVGSLKQNLATQNVKWVNPDNYHITLKFFGSTEEAKMSGIMEALGNCASKVVPFSLSVKGVGVFLRNNIPSIIWLGIENTSGLVSLYDYINSSLLQLGYLPDRSTFAPHLTIGRIKEAAGAIESINPLKEFSDKQLAIVPINSFSLMESLLQPQGPKYFEVRRFLLKNVSSN